MKLYYVEWIDSQSTTGWIFDNDDDYIDELIPSKCKTVGWLLRETNDCIVLAQSTADGNSTTERMCIPKCCIKKKRIIKIE